MTNQIMLSAAAAATYQEVRETFKVAAAFFSSVDVVPESESVLEDGSLQLVFSLGGGRFPIEVRLTIPATDWRYTEEIVQ